MPTVDVSDFVIVGETDTHDGKLKPFPGIVIEGNRPDDPEGMIGVLVFSYKGAVPYRASPFSPSLAEGAWSLPS